MPTDRQKQRRFGCGVAHASEAGAASGSAAGVQDEMMDVGQAEALATPEGAGVVSSLPPLATGDMPQGAATEGARKVPARSCVVCGDRAQGFNFNAITCQSCKAFFRRTAIKALELKCAMSGDCHLDVHTRRFCPACRLRKCYATGMKRELILDDEEKARRKEKVLRNREEKLRALKDVHSSVVQAATSSAASSAATRHPSCGLGTSNSTGNKERDVAMQLSIDDISAASADGSELLRKSGPAAASSAAVAAVGQLLTDTGALSHDVSSRSSAGDDPNSVQSIVQSSISEDGVDQGGDESRNGMQRTVCVVHPFSSSAASSSSSAASSSSSAASSSSSLPVAARVAKPAVLLPSQSGAGVVDPMLQLSLLHEPPLRRTLTNREAAELSVLGRNFLQAFCVSAGDGGRGPSLDSYRDSGPKFFAQRAKFLLRGLLGFSSTLRDFTGLPRVAQASLLRSAATSCMLLRSAQLYDPTADLWDDGHGTVFRQTELNLAFAGEADMFSQSAALARSFKKLFPELPVSSVAAGASSALAPAAGTGASGRWMAGEGDDSTLYALLHAITVLSPEHAVCKPEAPAADASASENSRDVFGDVSDSQQHYATLLRRHLEATYSFAYAADLLPSLLQRLCMYKCFSQQARRLLSALEPFEPLLRSLPR